ncbi:hypothetical protein G6L99_08200 [Agrobacterium rhizogenes]|uniref:hypothetical protein n=1 Tax=Rhizobium rhizogenes TaxID=359 RepID=UPI00026EC981|nr:hypothetical protein [Rhizobium rhizogenes]EJK87281.1 hypothetical protein PMI03_01292 [Rhizobium sp. AP16]NTH12090.1 hypothetical protein [Rhizobium rhizogenes]
MSIATVIVALFFGTDDYEEPRKCVGFVLIDRALEDTSSRVSGIPLVINER